MRGHMGVATSQSSGLSLMCVRKEIRGREISLLRQTRQVGICALHPSIPPPQERMFLSELSQRAFSLIHVFGVIFVRKSSIQKCPPRVLMDVQLRARPPILQNKFDIQIFSSMSSFLVSLRS